MAAWLWQGRGAKEGLMFVHITSHYNLFMHWTQHDLTNCDNMQQMYKTIRILHCHWTFVPTCSHNIPQLF